MKMFYAGHAGNKIEIENLFPNRLLSYYYIQNKTVDMKLYFALSYSPFTEMDWAKEYGIEKILTSFHVIGKTKKKETIRPRVEGYQLFLDSGAFSAFTKGITIDIEKYCEFIKETKDIWKTYATLDVIGDSRATRVNTEFMEQKGLNPLPVFHYKSPLPELERLIDKYDYFALGGLVPLAKAQPELQRWLDYCFRYIMPAIKKKGLRIHGFGVNSLWAWKRYPFYSVDSTSWNQGSKYGRVKEMEGSKMITADRSNPEAIQKLYRDKDWKVRTIKNIETYLEAEKLVTRMWTEKGIVFM